MKVTIKKFQELYKISMTDFDEIDKSIELVKCLTGKTDFEIDKMHPRKFNKVCKVIARNFERFNTKLFNDKPRQVIKANGTWYYINYDVEQLPINAGRYVEVATFKEDIIGNLHLLLASMSNPMRRKWNGRLVMDNYNANNHSKVANDFLHADFTVAYHASVFFWAVFKDVLINSQTYLLSKAKNKKAMETSLQNFLNVSDGLIMPKWLVSMKALS